MTNARCIHGMDIIPRGMGAPLGPHTQERSWIVNAETGLPTDYSRDDMHPSLFRANEMIGRGTELVVRMTAWKARRQCL